MGVKFRHCMKITAVMGEIWLGQWGLWLMVVQVSFLKCDVLSQFQDRYSKVLLSQLMTSSFKGNKLYSLPFRFTEQKARLGGKLSLFYNELTGNHRPLTATSQVVLSGKSKFTTQLYNLFLFGLPHLDLWTWKDVSSFEIEWKWSFWEKSLVDKNVLRRNIKLDIRLYTWQQCTSIHFWGFNNVILTEYRHFPG